ncbi:hypothetical protein FEF26_11315 [Nesterenkonia salmonea]|uniref:Uncharacterized protein n=1 Tax=Nesterenkonia salmonea TaxID=1804987 RepID=A0A5R9B946_9MICC|nr:hypothetical protein [Nesterenkonia salmonea]TLP94888.1 hypothetical protein FEF26_11315 [Nesterenkonia salmonea]
MSAHSLSHVLFGAATLLALTITVSAVGELLGWWQRSLDTSLVVSGVAVSLVLTLCASYLRRDKRGAASQAGT